MNSLDPPGDPFGSTPSRGRTIARWAFGGLLVINLFALLVALSCANVTAEGPAKRSLRQSIAILTEVDAFLDERYDAFRQEAAQSEARDEQLTLPDFPVLVSFTPDEVLGSDRDAFRALLLSRAADRVHEEGASAFQEGEKGDVGFLSTQGAVRNGLDFQRSTPNDALAIPVIVLAVLAAALTVALLLNCGGYGRIVALGLSVSLAALIFLISAIALRFALRLAADGVDDYLMEEFLTLGQELAWAPIRNGIIFSVGGGAVLLLGVALARWNDRRVEAPTTVLPST